MRHPRRPFRSVHITPFADIADLAATTGVGATGVNQQKTANSRLPQDFTANSAATLGGVSLSSTEHRNMVDAANNAASANAECGYVRRVGRQNHRGRNGGNYTTAVDLRAALSNDTGPQLQTPLIS